MQHQTLPSYLLQDVLVGTDVVDLARVERQFNRFGIVFFKRLLTDKELSYCLTVGHAGNTSPHPRQIQRLASRIAAKEAIGKALGVGLNGLGYGQGVSWQEIEVVSAMNQAPSIQLHGGAKALADGLGCHRIKLSLSHDGPVAMAVALILINSNYPDQSVF